MTDAENVRFAAFVYGAMVLGLIAIAALAIFYPEGLQ